MLVGLFVYVKSFNLIYDHKVGYNYPSNEIRPPEPLVHLQEQDSASAQFSAITAFHDAKVQSTYQICLHCGSDDREGPATYLVPHSASQHRLYVPLQTDTS